MVAPLKIEGGITFGGGIGAGPGGRDKPQH